MKGSSKEAWGLYFGLPWYSFKTCFVSSVCSNTSSSFTKKDKKKKKIKKKKDLRHL